MSHLDRRQREKEVVKQRILSAAREIAIKEGWHAVTIRKIADEIEYTPPIVYEYFENKEDLIRELVYTGFSMLSKEFHEAHESETDSKKLIKILSIHHWDFAFKHTELYQLMFSLERPVPNEEMKEVFKMIENLFREFAKDDEKLLRELIFNWMCLMQGAISIVMKMPSLPHQKGRDPKDVYSSIITRFIDGL